MFWMGWHTDWWLTDWLAWVVWNALNALTHWLTYFLTGLTGLEGSGWSDTLTNLLSEWSGVIWMVWHTGWLDLWVDWNGLDGLTHWLPWCLSVWMVWHTDWLTDWLTGLTGLEWSGWSDWLIDLLSEWFEWSGMVWMAWSSVWLTVWVLWVLWIGLTDPLSYCLSGLDGLEWSGWSDILMDLLSGHLTCLIPDTSRQLCWCQTISDC